jgi:hypothetical protein
MMNSPCDPVIENIRFDGQPDPHTSERLKILFDEDQAPRSEPVDWTDPDRLIQELGPEYMNRAEEEARCRRVEVLQLLQQGKVNLPQDLYHAAMIFQHGTCSDHFKLANELAERSVILGYQPARWLYAASLDRYLVSIGKPQQFGTQLHWDKQRGWTMPPLDSRTTDEDRAAYAVPPIAELWQRLRNHNRGRKSIRTTLQILHYEWRAWWNKKRPF